MDRSTVSPMRRDLATTARRLAIAAFAVDGAVLGATGPYLTFRYRPAATAAFPDVFGPDGRYALLRWSQSVHRVSAWIALGLCLAVVILYAVDAGRRSGRRLAVASVGGVAVFVALLVGIVSGPLIAWTQIALWAVTVGSNVRGVYPPRSITKYFIVDGHQISPGTFSAWRSVHIFVVPVIAIVAVVALVLAARNRPSDTAPEEDPAAELVPG
jgi:quinol-cytochrome oxidoreductase complex cytochrome b subunit